MTITKERLPDLVERLEQHAVKLNCHDADMAHDVIDAAEGLRMLLSGIEQNLAGYMNRFTGRVYSLNEKPGADSNKAVYMPVYTAPQFAPVGLDELYDALQELAEAMHQYEMDVDGPSPDKHKAMMQRTDALLDGYRKAVLNHFVDANNMVEPVSPAYRLPAQISASMAKEKAFRLGAVLNDEEAEMFAEGWNIYRYTMLKLNHPENVLDMVADNTTQQFESLSSAP